MDIVLEILERFEQFRMDPLPNDVYESIGKQKLAAKISKFVDIGKPIDFVMLGFPMKSPNSRDKVLGTMPDLAEEMAITRFQHFGDRIAEVYKPGIKMHIVSDGFVFNDVMNVADTIVQQYEEICLHMAKAAPVQWYDLRDFYDKNLSMATMRDKVISHFGITDAMLEQRILMDPDVNTLYRGMIKFMTGDLAMNNYPSNSQLQKQAKILARAMMFRNEAYSQLVSNEFSDCIRLSMHHTINNGNKFSYQLITGKNVFTSPWHCALVMHDDGQVSTVHRKDAITSGYQIVEQDGRPYYFVTTQN